MLINAINTCNTRKLPHIGTTADGTGVVFSALMPASKVIGFGVYVKKMLKMVYHKYIVLLIT